jgi:DNA-directed RNA polymerase specialized sigma24 family protein
VHEETDRDLLRRHAAGERTAFGVLYRKYYRRVFSYCLRLTQNRQAVEEIVATVFLKALQSARSLDNPDLFFY